MDDNEYAAKESGPPTAQQAGGDLFVNRSFSWDKGFMLVPNAWIDDPRVRGNPLSMFLVIRRNVDGFRMSSHELRRRTGFGRTAFYSARAALVDAGYLRVTVRRQPPGALDERTGRSIAGQVIGNVYETFDPSAQTPDAPVESQVHETGMQRRSFPQTDGREIYNPWSAAESRNRVAGDQEAGQQDPGFVSPKETKDLRDQDDFVDHGSSSAYERGNQSDVEPAAAVQRLLSAVHPRLDLVRLQRGLEARNVRHELVDLVAASREVVDRSRAALIDVNAYVATGIERDPHQWPRRSLVTGRALVACDLDGHNWRDYGDDAYCIGCGVDHPRLASRRGVDDALGTEAS